MSQQHGLPVWARWLRVFAVGSSIIATGFVLYRYTTPTPEQLIARFSPEIRADYERNKELREKEQQELMKIVKRTSQSNDPIWKTDVIKSPFERDGRGQDPKLVDIKAFEKERAERQQKAEIEKFRKELEETEKLVKQEKKKGWFS